MQLREGTELQGGKYRVVRVLGQGGFGITYLVMNVFLGKLVAIKEFFPKDFCGRDSTSRLTLGTENNAETVEKLKARFLKEAKNIAKLDHPGIVKIHDIFEENNTAYYVMDYIEGENLNEMVKRGGALSEQKALDYIRKVGDALDYVHSRNMTHFDVKPANIVVRHSDNQPILVDFGLSKQYDMHGDATSTLMQGVSHGYSPIELYNPGSLKTFSPETDVYSLGATLYFLLTQVTPPAASEVAESGLTFPPTISDSTKAAIESAMKLSRAKRPKQITMFVESLSGKKPVPAPASVSEDTVIIGTMPPSKPASSANGGVSSAKPKSSSKPASASRGGGTPKKRKSSDSSSSGCWWLLILILGIVLIVGIAFLEHSDEENGVQKDSVVEKAVVDEVVESDWDVDAVACDSVAAPSEAVDYGDRITPDCVVRYIDDRFDGKIRVPTYLAGHTYVNGDWTEHSNLGSELKYKAFYTSQSPMDVVNSVVSRGGHNYEVSKADFAVRSCVIGRRIYYARAAKQGALCYVFVYSIPLDDKANLHTYNVLTEKISKNFPIL